MSRGALLLAMAVVLQSLRLIIPMPLQVSTFLIGTLVHMMLVITVHYASVKAAILIGCILPVIAYLQGQLLFPILIPLVIIANSIFVMAVEYYSKNGISWKTVLIPPLVKALFMAPVAFGLLWMLQLGNPYVRKMILFGMSVPQFVTGIAGLILARYILNRYRNL